MADVLHTIIIINCELIGNQYTYLTIHCTLYIQTVQVNSTFSIESSMYHFCVRSRASWNWLCTHGVHWIHNLTLSRKRGIYFTANSLTVRHAANTQDLQCTRYCIYSRYTTTVHPPTVCTDYRISCTSAQHSVHPNFTYPYHLSRFEVAAVVLQPIDVKTPQHFYTQLYWVTITSPLLDDWPDCRTGRPRGLGNDSIYTQPTRNTIVTMHGVTRTMPYE